MFFLMCVPFQDQPQLIAILQRLAVSLFVLLVAELWLINNNFENEELMKNMMIV